MSSQTPIKCQELEKNVSVEECRNCQIQCFTEEKLRSFEYTYDDFCLSCGKETKVCSGTACCEKCDDQPLYTGIIIVDSDPNEDWVFKLLQKQAPYYSEEKYKIERGNLKLGDIALESKKLAIERKGTRDIIRSIREKKPRSKDQYQRMLQAMKEGWRFALFENYEGYKWRDFKDKMQTEKSISTFKVKFGTAPIPVFTCRTKIAFAWTVFQWFHMANPEYIPQYHILKEVVPEELEITAKMIMQVKGIGQEWAVKIADAIFPDGILVLKSMTPLSLTKKINSERKKPFKIANLLFEALNQN